MIRTALFCVFVVMSIAAPARAQTSPKPSLNLTRTGLVSIQPGDATYLGSPYLDRTLSGIGPGIAAGLHFIDSQRHFIVPARSRRSHRHHATLAVVLTSAE
jgi:hypothetical protein